MCFGYVFLEKGVPRQKSRKLPPLPPTGHPLHQQLKDEAAVDIACGGKIEFSRCVNNAGKSGTIRDSHLSLSEPRGCSNAAAGGIGSRKRTTERKFAELIPKDLPVPTDTYSAETANRFLRRIIPGLFVHAGGEFPSTIRIVKAEYKLFSDLTPEEVENEGLPQVDTHGHAIPIDKTIILLRRIVSLFSGEDMSR